MSTQTAIRQLHLALRVALFLFIVFFGVAFLVAGAKEALAANLRPVATIKNNVITLGDLFDGLSKERAAYVLGPAPLPGQDMVLNAKTLLRVAIALDLPWRPASTAEQITLRRDATLIDTQALNNLLERALRDKGLEGDFHLEYSNGTSPQIILPADQSPSVKLSALNFSPQTDWFEASFVAAGGTPDVKRLNVTGMVRRLVDVPVLKKALRNGDIVRDTDLDWISVEAKDLQSDTLIKAEELIGQTPRRMVMAGKLIRDKELQAPQLVSRGETVTILFEQGPLLLSAKGRALENGARNDLIRVVNMSSSRSIDALVTADGVVKVSE